MSRISSFRVLVKSYNGALHPYSLSALYCVSVVQVGGTPTYCVYQTVIIMNTFHLWRLMILHPSTHVAATHCLWPTDCYDRPPDTLSHSDLFGLFVQVRASRSSSNVRNIIGSHNASNISLMDCSSVHFATSHLTFHWSIHSTDE